VVSVQTLAELMAAGLQGDDLLAACRRIEEAEAKELAKDVSPAALRMRRYRALKKQAETLAGSVTRDVTRSSNPSLSKLDSSERESNATVMQLVTPHAKAASTKGTPLPDDWLPSDESRNYARKLNLSEEQIQGAHESFCNHFDSVSGQKAIKRNWDAAWCLWMRREKQGWPDRR
jgi:hypothetical protein